MTNTTESRKRAQASVRRAALIEGLERRSLLSTSVVDNGAQIGELDIWQPEGGRKAIASGVGRGSASGDGTPGYQIDLAFTGGLTPSQQAVFSQAAARWEAILTGDVADNSGTPYGFIDDIRIEAEGAPNDGVGKILGHAGPEYYRGDSKLPITGFMSFDSADIGDLEARGLLDEVIVHEMGHVLGVGTMWNTKGLVTGATTTDPRFTGPRATAEYNALAGLTGSSGVPVANEGGAGTQDAHWRERGTGGPGMGNELMTGIINGSQANPLSRVSAASMVDMGYPLVNVDATDLYTVPIDPGNGGGGSFAAVNPLPVVGSLAPSSTTVAPNASFLLNLSSATDNGSVGSVAYHRETNGIAGLQTSPYSGTVTADTAVATNSGPGLVATVPGLSAGSYTFYAQAKDNFGARSRVTATSVTVAAVVAPSAPSAPTLPPSIAAVANSNVLTFTGTAAANSTVTLKSGTATLGVGTTDPSGNYSVTTGTLADATYEVYALASNSAGSSPASGTTVVRVDTVRPTVQATAYDREVSQSLTVTLSEVVAGGLTAASVTLQNLTTGTTTAVGELSVREDGAVLTIRPAARLVDGNYQLSISAGNVTDLAGNTLASPYVYDFRQLAGDADNNGTVNFGDLVVLAQNYNVAGKTFSQGNFNYSSDGKVDFADLVILAQNYNKTLAPPAVAAPAATTTSSSSLKSRTSIASSVIV